MNRFLRISGSSTLYPVITSSEFSSSTSQYLSRILQKPEENSAAKINIMKNGTIHIEPIYYSTLSEFQTQISRSNGIPALLRDKNNNIISNHVVNRILNENASLSSSDTSKYTIQDMYLMGLYIIVAVIFLFIAYNTFPYLWSLKGYNS
jgi:hypothetical protein